MNKLNKRFAGMSLMAALSILASVSDAQTLPVRTANVNLAPPNKWEDGSALDCSVAGACTYNVYRGPCNGTKTKVVTGATTTTIPVPSSTAGQCFTATAVSAGSESMQSAEAKFRGAPGTPTVTVVVTIAVEVPQ